jgi:5-hydroxyisourate hydrolase-like protein (transthyretin family)
LGVGRMMTNQWSLTREMWRAVNKYVYKLRIISTFYVNQQVESRDKAHFDIVSDKVKLQSTWHVPMQLVPHKNKT